MYNKSIDSLETYIFNTELITLAELSLTTPMERALVYHWKRIGVSNSHLDAVNEIIQNSIIVKICEVDIYSIKNEVDDILDSLID